MVSKSLEPSSCHSARSREPSAFEVAPVAMTHAANGKLAPRARGFALLAVGRFGKPEDVVEAIMMLVVNSYMTNQTLLVDGGMYPH